MQRKWQRSEDNGVRLEQTMLENKTFIGKSKKTVETLSRLIVKLAWEHQGMLRGILSRIKGKAELLSEDQAGWS